MPIAAAPTIRSAATAIQTVSGRPLVSASSKRRGERRQIAEDADPARIAALERRVPEKERGAERAESGERDQHQVATGQGNGRLEDRMTGQREDARDEAEQAHRRGRKMGDATRQQRIARPDEGRSGSGEVAPGEASGEAATADDRQRRADEADQRRADVHRPQREPGQEHRRQHDDEQRPQIVDEVGLERRRVAQGDEEQEVEAEQAVDAEGERRPGHAPLARERPGRHAADDQRQAGEQERRHVRERDAERGERRPECDRAEREECSAHRDRAAADRGRRALSARSATRARPPARTPRRVSACRSGRRAATNRSHRGHDAHRLPPACRPPNRAGVAGRPRVRRADA